MAAKFQRCASMRTDVQSSTVSSVGSWFALRTDQKLQVVKGVSNSREIDHLEEAPEVVGRHILQRHDAAHSVRHDSTSFLRLASEEEAMDTEVDTRDLLYPRQPGRIGQKGMHAP
jgi:hypothetical protein